MSKKLFYTIWRTMLGLFACVGFVGTMVFAADTVSRTLDTSSSTTAWTSASTIWFSTGWVSSDGTASGSSLYINNWNDTQVISNYLSGFYYDTNYGFFAFSWTGATSLNVHVSDVTTKCGAWVYGFRFAWYAKGAETALGNTVWLINFWYDNNIFVYYCDNDKKLHGYAYSEDIGFQSFEWIAFEVGAVPNIGDPFSPKVDPFFVNNNSAIISDTNQAFNSIQSDVISTDWWKESIFYIIK